MRFLVLALMGMMACSGGSGDDDDTGATEDDDDLEDDDDDDDDEEEEEADPVRVDAVLALTGSVTDGGPLYDDNCAVCHGLNGEGGVGPSMANALGEADPEIVGILLTGEDSMPSFATWTDQELADVLAFIRDTF